MKRRKSTKTTKRQDPLVRNLKYAWRGFIRNGKNLLAGAGLFWLVWTIAKAL